MEKHGVLTIAMTDGIIGCPHQEGIDHEGESCPVCEFWRGRDRFTDKGSLICREINVGIRTTDGSGLQNVGWKVASPAVGKRLSRDRVEKRRTQARRADL